MRLEKDYYNFEIVDNGKRVLVRTTYRHRLLDVIKIECWKFEIKEFGLRRTARGNGLYLSVARALNKFLEDK